MNDDNEVELTEEEETALILNNPVWDSVASALVSADSMAWDDCHKIYIHMDKEQTEESKTKGFEPVAPNLDVIKDWFVRSCGLAFVSSIRTAQEGETWDDGYTQIISQTFDFNLTPDENEKEMAEFIREMQSLGFGTASNPSDELTIASEEQTDASSQIGRAIIAEAEAKNAE